ncbi:MAG: hypothetical protein LBS89_08745, partial [Zoogloeaceae bacterium]|nr:hypothetical protein [Zoogloeaceae bacterium]
YISSAVEVPAADRFHVTDLNINQAIKKAIGSDIVLSKLLKVTDGPANTLVITALSDGRHLDVNDLQIEFAIPTTVSTTDAAAWRAAIGADAAWADADLLAGRVEAFNQLLISKGSNLIALPGTVSDLDNYGVNAGGNYTSWYTSNNQTVLAGHGDYKAAFANTGADLAGTNSDHVSDNIINAGSGDDVIVLSTGELSNDTIKWTDFNQGTNTIVNFETDGTTLGDDWLDFTSYGAKWLAAATLDATGKVNSTNGWDVATDLRGAHNGSSSYNQALPGWLDKTTNIAYPELYQVNTGDKYITLTRAYEEVDANSTVAGTEPHRSTLYKIELWTVNGNEADAYRDIVSTEVRDSAQLIGYVDLGKVIDAASFSTDDVLSHIDYIL